jgi:hypothetical protein
MLVNADSQNLFKHGHNISNYFCIWHSSLASRSWEHCNRLFWKRNPFKVQPIRCSWKNGL